ncbi:MAG TPA: bifunctional phosphopantothenoylcysteine decarboxylase/phosphopantothenate--cysteine ligase CoaBC [Clostridia bacterium]|nr:bifunctional phosphopantothenoylcysteine decarboxylase/phosphopantothenate--cysteine ligase CoaBC [Clostridia bacterium]
MKQTVIVGISGGIAAYKSCEVVSKLKQLGYTVKVIMTKNALEFVSKLTVETLSGNEVITDMFAEKKHFDVEHISLAKEASLFLVCPSTANLIAKFAQGIADDMLSTTFLASKAIKVVCPAMNTGMYTDEANLNNLQLLKERGVHILEPNSGYLACGDIGQGRMSEPKEIISYVDNLLAPNPDFRGKTVLVTAGATIEDIDGVRYISNYSSGKMGVALANAVIDRGGDVIFIAGNISVAPPKKAEIISVKSTDDMYNAVMNKLQRADIIIKAAAPADYKVDKKFSQKIKSEKLTLDLVKNPDIAKEIGLKKGNKILVVFSAETNDLMTNAAKKLESKNADMIVANDVTQEGAGFMVDTNIATIIYADGRIDSLPIMSKEALANIILDGVKSI